jgi:hypothetical protein
VSISAGQNILSLAIASMRKNFAINEAGIGLSVYTKETYKVFG